MKPKVVLNQTRSVNDIFEDTVLFLKQNRRALFKAYLSVCGYPLLATLAVYGFEQIQTAFHLRLGDYTFGITYFIRVLLTVVNVVLLNLTALAFMVLYKENDGRTPEKEDVYSYVKYYFLRIFVATVLLGFILFVGFILGGVPGIYFWPIASLILTIMVLENADMGYAFGRAFGLIKNRWWETAGALILISILIWAVNMLLMFPVTLISGTVMLFANIPFNDIYQIVFYIHFVVFMFTAVLSPISMALIYFNLNELSGDKHLLERIEMLGRTETKVNHVQAEDY